jgi:hypothetical protein
MANSVTMTEVSSQPGFTPRSDVDVTILPSISDGDCGIYPLAATGLIDELRETGVPTGTMHDSDHCDWHDERSGWGDLALQIAMGIGSAAGWDGVKRLFTNRRGKVKLTLVYQDRSGTRWVQMEGESNGVANAMEKIDPFGPSDG